MSTLKLSILFIYCAGIVSCSQVAPFEDRRREPGTEYVYIGSSKPEAPVICYNPLFYNKTEIKKQADTLCDGYQKGAHAELIDIDYFTCRLFVPSKAYYKCVVDK